MVNPDELYSSFVVTKDRLPIGDMNLFVYGRGQPITNNHRAATTAHTNMPRTSYAGLPMGWEFQISRLRALCYPLVPEPEAPTKAVIRDAFLEGKDDTAIQLMRQMDATRDCRPLLDWLSVTSYEFVYYDKAIRRGVLLDLILNPADLDLWMSENLSFRVTVTTQRDQPARALCEWLGDRELTCWLFLGGKLTTPAY